MGANIDKGAPPPKELVLGWDMEHWQALPDAGGLLDQDAGMMQRIRVLLNVHRVYSRLRNMKGDEIHKLTNSDRRIIGALKKMKLI